MAADGRLCTASDAVKKLSHGAGERIGKPNFFPARRERIPGLVLGCEIYDAGLPVRVTRPTDCALRHSIRAFYPPADVPISDSIGGWSGPYVIPSRGSEAVGIFQDVQADTVTMGKLRPWIPSRTDKYAFRITEQVAEGIEMMNAHVQEREAAVVSEPGLPMWNRPHLYGGQNRFSKITAIEHCFQRSNRLVEAHILVDCQGDAGVIAKPNNLASIGIICGQRLLTENTSDVVVVPNGCPDDPQLLIGWDRNVKDHNR